MLTVVLIYLCFLLIVGLSARRRGRSTVKDYITSSRDHGTWLSALSASASSESGWVMLGLVGTAYTSGISCMWLLPGCVVGYLFNWCILGPRIHKLTNISDSQNLADLFESRFPNASPTMIRWVRFFVIASVVIFLTVYASAQFSATGKAFNAMFGWDYRIGVGLGVALIVTYTLLGGLRAVSWTDVPQAALMFFTLLILPFIIILSIHTNTSLLADLMIQNPTALSWTAGASGWTGAGLVLGWLGIGLGYPGQPHVLRRFMTTASLSIYKRATIISLVWSQIVFMGAIIIGLAARVRFPHLTDPEQALPYAAVHLLPPTIAGLALAGVLSAMWSTADGQLFEAATSLIAGFSKNKICGPRFVRVVVLIFGLLAGSLAAFKTQIIFDVVLYAWGALGAGIGASLSVILLWRKATIYGALAGLIVGPTTLYLWKSVFQLSSVLYELIPAFIAGLIATLLISMLTRHIEDVENNG